MNLRDNFMLVLAGAILCLGIADMIHPFGFRVPASVLVVVALLLGLRWAMRRQGRKRVQAVNEVPKHPLGIVDDDE